jgi:hypothetical protein
MLKSYFTYHNLTTVILVNYRVIHKTLQNFRTWLRNNQDRHSRKEHINRYRISSKIFCVLGAVAYLQVSPLGAVMTKHGMDRE